MKHFLSRFAVLAAIILFVIPTKAQSLRLNKSNIDLIIDSLTLEEKIHLLVGPGMRGLSDNDPMIGQTENIVPGAAGTTYPIPRLGIPAIVLADGPAGVRIAPERDNDPATYYATAFPVGTLLSSTWNVPLIEKVGQAIGNEALEYGIDVLLAPALNIQRNPLGGRNYEYYSEDPVLSGKTAAAYVRGVQQNGVGTSIKHFAVNNQETNRGNVDARISQRALREIYLRGFEIAVKESYPWTVMSSYNKINGVSASQNEELLIDVLRDEWGFEGTVMTDWFGGYDAAEQMLAGNELLMPGRPDQYEAIMKAVEDKQLDVDILDRNVKKVLELIVKTPRFKKYTLSNKLDLGAHARVTRQSATEGMVLLKNGDGVLPLEKGIRRIAAFGVTSYDFISGGTGSGDVNEAYTVSLGEGLVNAGYQIDSGLKELYESYIDEENEKNKPDKDNRLAAFLPQVRPEEMVLNRETLEGAVNDNDVAIITLGRTSGEFADIKLKDFTLHKNEKLLIDAVTNIFHKAEKKVIVILNIGGVIETSSWKGKPDAILLAWQAGQEGGNSVADILKGTANPSGKLPVTFPFRLEDIPSYTNFPQDFEFEDPFDMVFGKPSESNDRPNIDFTKYEEGVFVGYRHFITEDEPVSYPFGFGLSYTTFEFSKPVIDGNEGSYTVKISIENTGKKAGKEVVQLYVSAPQNGLPKPKRELKAFAKTDLLQPGQLETVTFILTPKDLASFDEKKDQWSVATGDYTIEIGKSSEEIVQSIPVKLDREMVIEEVQNVLNLEKDKR